MIPHFNIQDTLGYDKNLKNDVILSDSLSLHKSYFTLNHTATIVAGSEAIALRVHFLNEYDQELVLSKFQTVTV
jgi:hypothetical protein